MSNYLLSSQGDRMLMANSIEGRYPFIDEDFVNICANIDSQTKAPTINSKQLFRSAFKDKLPDYIINQPKIAYQAPEAQCFVGENYMSDNVVELLDNIKDLHLINRKNFKDLIAKIQNPNSTRRLGFRENMAFMLCLSYFNLQKSLNNWSKI
jgi:asparagine synthase (glutamine-hydrolysing)